MEMDASVGSVLVPFLDAMPLKGISRHLLSANCAPIRRGLIHLSEPKMNEPLYCPPGIHSSWESSITMQGESTLMLPPK